MTKETSQQQQEQQQQKSKRNVEPTKMLSRQWVCVCARSGSG